MAGTDEKTARTAAPRLPASPGSPGSPLGASRFASRARAVRRSGWTWKLGVPALVVLLLAGAWFVWAGPVLVVRSVSLTGATAGTADQIRRQAAVPMGRPLARLDVAAVRERVESVPAVASADVDRSWPDGVRIDVVLRTPVAVVRGGGGVLHLADATGRAYATVPSAPRDLPVVDASASDSASVQAVIAVLGAMPAALRADVTSAGAQTPDSVELHLGDLTVQWGSAQDSDLKSRVLQALRHDQRSARHIDVSAPDAPAVG